MPVRAMVCSIIRCLAVGLAGLVGAANAQVPFKIVTASERGTYIQIGRDIARLVAPDAGIELEVLPSAGSAENVRRLRHEPGVKFALVQSDVYQAFPGGCRASGRARAGVSHGASPGAGEAVWLATQRVGNDEWRRESPRPFGLSLERG